MGNILTGMGGILLGIFCVLIGIFNWDLFYTPKRRSWKWFLELVGRKGARIYYMILGAVLIAVGIGVALRIID